MKQKALGLVMIVKNEVATINTTLGSMRDMIDYWTIVDTGSTDGTQVTSSAQLLPRIECHACSSGHG